MIEGVGVLSQTPRCMEFTYYTMFPEGDGGGEYSKMRHIRLIIRA